MARRGAAGEDLSNVEFETSEDVEVVPTFNSMGLREELLRAIYAYGKFSHKSCRHNIKMCVCVCAFSACKTSWPPVHL